MISELSQPARIASLECGLVKIPFLPEVFVSNVGGPYECHSSFAWRPAQHILFCFFFRFSCCHARSIESASAFCGRAGADLGH
jgi:hypothetical protein